MTGVGMNLTEYTYKELRLLSTAVIREQTYGSQDKEPQEILSQWQTKLIEAMVQVKIKENIQSN